MSEWKPISTAPKDGTYVLVYCKPLDPVRRSVFEASWRIPWEGAPDNQGYWQTARLDGSAGTMLSADVHIGSNGKPLGATHWMPMPTPPAQDESSERR